MASFIDGLQRLASAAWLPYLKGTGLVLLGALGSYVVNNGSQPSSPTSPARMSDPVAELAALVAKDAIPDIRSTRAVEQQGLGTVDEMIDRLAARLVHQPSDAEGWRMLGWSYFSMQRFPEAVRAYAKAIDHDRGNGGLHAAYAEAIVHAAGGTITTEAREAIDQANQLNPADPRARYLRGLVNVHDGAKQAALNIWSELLNAASMTDAWAGELEQKVASLRRELEAAGNDPAAAAAKSSH